MEHRTDERTEPDSDTDKVVGNIFAIPWVGKTDELSAGGRTRAVK